LNAEELFHATRPPDCPDPVTDEPDGEDQESGPVEPSPVGLPNEGKYRQLSGAALQAEQQGNAARATVLWKRAALVAPRPARPRWSGDTSSR